MNCHLSSDECPDGKWLFLFLTFIKSVPGWVNFILLVMTGRNSILSLHISYLNIVKLEIKLLNLCVLINTDPIKIIYLKLT